MSEDNVRRHNTILGGNGLDENSLFLFYSHRGPNASQEGMEAYHRHYDGEHASLLAKNTVQSLIRRGLRKIILEDKPDWIFYSCRKNCLEGNILILKEEAKAILPLQSITTVVVGLYVVDKRGTVTAVGDYTYQMQAKLQ